MKPSPLGLLCINRLNYFCYKIRFRGDIRKVSDSAQVHTAQVHTAQVHTAQVHTAQSQTLEECTIVHLYETRPHMLIFRKICGNPKLAYTVWGQTPRRLTLHGVLLASILSMQFSP